MIVEELKRIRNKTLPYLFPLVTSKNSKISDFKDDTFFPKCNFVNVFRYSELHSDLDKHLFVIYKYSPNPQFEVFIERLKRSRNFYSVEDIDKYMIMIIYKFPSEYLKALTKFDNGQYSKLKNEEKLKILSFYSVTSQDKFGPAGVLFKKDWRREEIETRIGMKLPDDAELSSIPDLEQETFFKKYLNDAEGNIRRELV